jgi:hypothetical protein
LKLPARDRNTTLFASGRRFVDTVSVREEQQIAGDKRERDYKEDHQRNHGSTLI